MVPQDTWLLRLRAHVVQPAAVNKAVQQHMHQWSDSTRRYLQAVGVHTASQDVPDRRVHAVPHVPLSKTTPKARLFCQLTGFVVDVDVQHVVVHAPLCHQSMIKPQYNTKQGNTKHGCLGVSACAFLGLCPASCCLPSSHRKCRLTPVVASAPRLVDLPPGTS